MPLIKTYRTPKDFKSESSPECARRAELTRRQFMKTGITGMASFFLPTGVASQLIQGNAEALTCPPASGAKVGYVTIAPADGPVLSNIVFPYGPDGRPLSGLDLNRNSAVLGVDPSRAPLPLGRGAPVAAGEILISTILEGPGTGVISAAGWATILRDVSVYGVGAESQDDGNGRNQPRTAQGIMQVINRVEIPSDLRVRSFMSPVDFTPPPSVLNVGPTLASLQSAVGFQAAAQTSTPLMRATVDSALALSGLLGFTRDGKRGTSEMHTQFSCGLMGAKTKVGNYGETLFNPQSQPEITAAAGNIGLNVAGITDQEMLVTMMGAFRAFKGTFSSFTTGMDGYDEHLNSNATNITLRTNLGRTIAFAILGAWLSGNPGIVAMDSAGSANSNGFSATGVNRIINGANTATYIGNARDDNGTETYGGVPRFVVHRGSGGRNVRNLGWWDPRTGAYTRQGPLRGDLRMIALSDAITLAALGGLPVAPLISMGVAAGLLRSTREGDEINALVS